MGEGGASPAGPPGGGPAGAGGGAGRRAGARAVLRGAALPAAGLLGAAGAGGGAARGLAGPLGLAAAAAGLARLPAGALPCPPPGRPQGAAWGPADAAALFAVAGSSGALFSAWPTSAVAGAVWPRWGGPLAVAGILAGLAGCCEAARRERLGRMPPGFEHEDGGRYSGQWRGRNKHGAGCYVYPNGDSFEGGWQFNRKHGEGVYRFAQGGFYAGGWEAGERHGPGVRVHPSGREVAGVWVRGRLKGGEPLADGGKAALRGAQAAVAAAQVASREARWDPLDALQSELRLLVPGFACAVGVGALGWGLSAAYVPAAFGALAILGMGTVGVHFPASGGVMGESGRGGSVSAADWATGGALLLLKYAAALAFAAVWTLLPADAPSLLAPVPEELLRLCFLPPTPLLLVYSRAFRLSPAWRRAIDCCLILGTFAFAVLPFQALAGALAAAPSTALGLCVAASACWGGARSSPSFPPGPAPDRPADTSPGSTRGPPPLAALECKRPLTISSSMPRRQALLARRAALPGWAACARAPTCVRAGGPHARPFARKQ